MLPVTSAAPTPSPTGLAISTTDAPAAPSWRHLEEVGPAARQGQARLRQLLVERAAGGLLVAFSGGVDSSYLLYEAHRQLGDRCTAAIAVSESLAAAELARARELATSWGVTLLEVQTHEMQDPRYRRNHADRCYFCKKALFTELEPLAARLGLKAIAYGAMADDLGDHRPGAQAAREAQVLAPLQEAGLGKDAIRWLSREAGLSTWNLPAQACLSSRFAYGQPIEARWLRAIETAEALLQDLGFHEVRVRHSGQTARIEVGVDELPRLVDPAVRVRIVEQLRALGYVYVSVDLAGFRSGSGNLALGSTRGLEPDKAQGPPTREAD